MANNNVTLTGQLPGAAGATAIFTPSNWLTDATNKLVIPPAPVQLTLDGNGKFSVSLLATDNGAPQPSGWQWTVEFIGIPSVAEYNFSFFLPFSGGATQDISTIVPAQAVTAMSAYLPLPSGTPTNGQVPIATGNGETSAWGYPPSGSKGYRPPDLQLAQKVWMGQPGHPFTFSGTGATGNNNDTSTFAIGNESIFVTTGGTGQNTKISGTFSQALNLTGQSLVIWLRMDAYAHYLGGYPRIYLGDLGLTNCYQWKLAESAGQPWALDGEWVRITLPFGSATVVGSPSRSSLASLTIQVFDDSAAPVTVHFGGIATMNESAAFPNGVLSICFDDGYGSALTNAVPYMDKYGFRGTSFVICETLFNHASFPSYLSLAQASALEQENGWEIGAHAFTAASHNSTYTGISDAAALADMQAAKSYLLAQGFKSPDIFAYPGGNFDAATVTNVRSLFSAGRTISQLGGFPDETPQPAIPSRIRGYAVSAVSGIANAQGFVTAAQANKEWLLLVFHDIQASASGNLQLSTANFQTLMDSVNSSGIQVMPVGDVMRYAPGIAIDPLSADIATIGASLAAGSTGRAADAGHVHTIPGNPLPSEVGVQGWTCDPGSTGAATTSSALVGGTVYLAEFWLRSASLLSNISLHVTAAPTGLTAGQCFAGIYDSTGTLRAVTADQSGAWATTGVKTMALTVPFTASPGRYYVAIVANGTLGTMTFRAGASVATWWNLGLSGANLRCAVNGTSQTSLPGSITLASNASAGSQPFAAVIS